MKFINLLILIISLFFSVNHLYAKKAASKKKSRSNYKVMYSVENGVAVYEEKNFDSPVKVYLRKDDKVLASKKIYKGPNGFGSFYKVRTKKGVGYVADIDVYYKNLKGKKAIKKDGAKEELVEESVPFNSNERTPASEESNETSGEPIYYQSFMGLMFSYVNMTETIAKKSYSSPMYGLGIKLTGPETLIKGLPLDTSLTYVHGAPDYYDKIAVSKATGFTLIADSIFSLPLIEKTTWGMYYGLGVVVTYTRNTLVVEIDNKNQDFDSEEIRLGAILQLALIKKIFTNYAIKIDGRYTYDSDPYYSGAVSFMMPY